MAWGPRDFERMARRVSSLSSLSIWAKRALLVLALLVCPAAPGAKAEATARPDALEQASADGFYRPKSVANLAAEHAFAGAESLNTDPRVVRWNALYEAWDFPELIAETEADLLGEDPHAYASYVWTRAQWSLGRLSTDRLPPIPEGLRPVLEPAARIFAYEEAMLPNRIIGVIPDLIATADLNYWGLFLALFEMRSIDNESMEHAVAEALLRSFPNDFEVGIVLTTRNTLHVHTKDPTLLDSPAGRWATWELQTPSRHDFDSYRLIALWAEEAPDDFNIHRRLGYNLAARGRYDESITHLSRAQELFPFYDLIGRVLARTYAQDNRIDEAREHATAFVSRDTPEHLRGVEHARRLTWVFREAGEFGLAREAALEGLTNHPGEYRLLVTLAPSLTKEGFTREVPPLLANAFAEDPSRFWAAQQLTSALQSEERYSEAIDTYERYREVGSYVDDVMFNNLRKAYDALGRHDEAAALYDYGVEAIPESHWALANTVFSLTKAGRMDEAFERARELALMEPSEWLLGRLADTGEKTGRSDEALAALKRIRYERPFTKSVWAEFAKLEDPEAIWTLAMERNPTRAFPYLEAAKVVQGEDFAGWRKAHQILNDGLNNLQANGAEAGELGQVLHNRAKLLQNAFKKSKIQDVSSLQPAFDDLDEARIYGLEEKTYWGLRYDLLIHAGPSEDLTLAWLKSVHYWPDHKGTVAAEFHNNDIGKFAAPKIGFITLDRMIRRQPRDASNLKSASHYHTSWGGSPVVAISLLEMFDRWNPDESYGKRKLEAYRALGAKKRHFESVYARSSSISASDRYVEWFDVARRDARKVENTIKTLDLKAMHILWIRPDGIEEEKRYDPITGQATFLRGGASKMEISYHPDSYLASIRTSEERWVELDYEAGMAFGRSRNIIEMRSAKEPKMRFEYGPNGKVTKIAMNGLGHIEVTYDDDGEIEKVKGVKADGSSEGGAQLALKITQSFQKFLSLVRSISQGNVLAFDVFEKDQTLVNLRDQVQEAQDRYDVEGEQIRSLALVEYLLAHIGDHPDHRTEAAGLIDKLFDSASYNAIYESIDSTADEIARGIKAVRLFHYLNDVVRRNGLPRDLWQRWRAMRGWALRQDASVAVIAAELFSLRDEIAEAPLYRLSSSGWLPRSRLSNPGYWRHYGQSEVTPKAFGSPTNTNAVLIRENGDVVIGSDYGFSVLRRGYWEWYAFDQRKQRFSRTVDLDEVDATSHVNAIYEDGVGRLWLGLANGLARLDGAYDDEIERWRSGSAGMIDGGVVAMAENGDHLAIGGAGGLAVVTLAGGEIVPLTETALTGLKAAADGWLSIEADGLWFVTANVRERLTDFQVTDAHYMREEELLYVLQGDVLLSRPWSGTGSVAAPVEIVQGQELIQSTAAPYALGTLPITEADESLAIYTDQGVSIYHEETFEHLNPPRATRPVPFHHGAHRDGRVFFLTDGGVASVEAGQAKHLFTDRVYDLLTDESQGVTFVAMGDRIELIVHETGAVEPDSFAGVDARVLTMMADKSILTHDGLDVVKIERETGDVVELFSASQTVPAENRQGNVTSLLAASDGTVWATAGSSLFRWLPGMQEAQEFSIHTDKSAFGANSDMLSRILETNDGRVLLIASNEGHRTHQGRKLAGGLFEWKDDKFTRINQEIAGSWFFSSYTPISETEAIVGTVSGFSRDENGRIEQFSSLDSPSYRALQEERPALFLGTEGTKVGDDLWLFGSASGVVGYRNGVWFDPDNLNWMLPGQELANYGARTVHAVETDPAGRIYVGTDLGLTVYDPLGTAPESFLISQGRADLAFSAFEEARMREVNEILLDAAVEDDQSAKLINRLRANRKKLAELEQMVAKQETMMRAADALSRDSEAAEDVTVAVVNSRKKLLRERQKNSSLILRLEVENPKLFNLLELNPIDLQAVGRSLPTGVIVAQYLPTKSKLYINLVSRAGSEIREVDVDRSELERIARISHQDLAAQAKGVTRAFEAPDTAEKAEVTTVRTVATENDFMTGRLAWLYKQLLGPIEQSIPKEATLIVSAPGALSYIPFAALVRDMEGDKPEYAIENMTFATAPSLYAVEQMVKSVPSYADRHVVFGDPDGSLPAARREAEEIAAALEPEFVELRLGDDATYEELAENSLGARFVHLAMHGKLDSRSPRNSYLLLAEGRRMQLPQMMTLPLADADLVFLSACETGLGAGGLEYRTIAHAFAHAGASAVLATLWQINSEATRKLALEFYNSRLDDNLGNAAALAAAQRTMLRGNEYSAPGLWAGFTVVGRP